MIRIRYYKGIDSITPYIIRDEAGRLSEGGSTVFVTPEYSKAQVEKMVLEELGRTNPEPVAVKGKQLDMNLSSSFTSGDVTSFIRLATDILSSCGRTKIAPGGDVELRNAIYSVLTGYREDFKKLAGFAGHYEYINGLINIIGDFVRYGIGPRELRDAVNAPGNDNEEYKAKISDIAFLMEKLELMNETYDLSLMTDPIKDAADVLTELAGDEDKLGRRRFRHVKDLVSSRFVVIGFGSARLLTPHEGMFIRALSDMGADIVFYTLADPSDKTGSGIYSVGNSFIDIMRTDYEADVEEYSPDKGEENDFISRCIESYISSDSSCLPGRDEVEKNIVLSQITDVDDRIGYVMNEIVDLTRNKGYRYKDIRIVCCDDDLMSSVTSVAEVFGLDLFIDKKVDLIDTVIPMFAETILMLPLTGYKVDVVLRAMYSGMLKIPPYLADAFDNYCRLKAITDGRRLFSEIFFRDKKTDDTGKASVNDRIPMVYIYENTVTVNGELLPEGLYPAGDIFWDHIIEEKIRPLKKIADEIYSASTLSAKAILLSGYLDSNRLFIEALRDELLEQKMDTAAQALVRGYDEIMKLLASFAHEMNDVPITQASTINLVRTDMKNKTEGTIPLRVDSVEITTPGRAYISPCKILFIIGADRSNFPSGRISDGIISSDELKTLAGSLKDISLPDKTDSTLKEQYVSSCLMMGTATDRIYMVHEYGAAVSRVFDFFKEYIEGDDRKIPANNYKFRAYETAVKKRFDFIVSRIAEEDMSVFAKSQMRCSVSALEQFNNCHFRYMAERMIRAKEREDNTEVKANAIGTVIHAMFENGLKDLGLKSGADLKDYCDRFIKDNVFDESELDRMTETTFAQAVNPKDVPSAYDQDGKISGLFERREGYKIKRIFRWMYPEIIKECRDTGFVPSGFEKELGKGDYEFNIKTDNGMNFIFNGYIDRFDMREESDGVRSVRIVDYKTGKKTISMTELAEGTQIQLPAYSYVLMQGLNKEGISSRLSNYGYLPLNLGTAKDKKLEFKPRMLFEEGVTSGKKGENYKVLSDNIDVLTGYAMETVKRSCNDIAGGMADARVNPAGNCDYCPYRGLCGNNASRPVKRSDSDLIPEDYSSSSADSTKKLIDNFKDSMGIGDE